MKKINMLFDATILTWAYLGGPIRSGLYFASYNILKQFAKDSRFNIALCVNSMADFRHYIAHLSKDAFFSRFPIVSTCTEKTDIYKSNIKKHKNSICTSKNILHRFLFIKKILKNYFYLSIHLKSNYFNFLDSIDIYFSGMNSAPLEVNKFKRIKHFLVLHDTVPIIFPQYYPNLKNEWYTEMIESLCKKNYYFCNSENTKNDFMKFFGKKLDKNKLSVIHHALSRNFHPDYDKKKLVMILEKYKVKYENNKYIFSFCTLEPRKNLFFTIRCFVKFIEKHHIDDLYFYIGGGAWDKFIGQLNESIDNFSAYSNKIVQLGYVDDEDVNILYSNSLFFTYISQYEGFGVPPLEAMQAGTPVITSNNSSLPEVVGDAAITITWNDEEACIKAFEDLYFNENIRKEYIARGIERAKFFSWEKTGKLMIDKILEIT
jgi:glycosyltransferase involved in cell wall biosynthesis